MNTINNVVALTGNTDINETIDAQIMAKHNLFEVESLPLHKPDGIMIPNCHGLFVDGQHINTVTDRYKAVQPVDILQTFESVSGLEVTRCLTNPNKGAIIVESKLPTVGIDGEQHQLFVKMYTNHSGDATILSFGALRMACFNQVPAIKSERSRHLMKCKHIQDFDFPKMRDIIADLPKEFREFKEQYLALKEISMSKKGFIDFFIEQFNIKTDTTRGQNRIERMADLYTYADGQSICPNNTAYKAYQALTYELTHNVKDTVNKMEQVQVKNQDKAHKLFAELLAA